MAAMDEFGRTESSLEHKFRKWRQKGRDIAAKNPENAGNLGTTSAGAATTKKPRAPAKKGADGRGKSPVKQANEGDEEDEIDEEAKTDKQEQDEMVVPGLLDRLTGLTFYRMVSTAKFHHMRTNGKPLRRRALRSALPLGKLLLQSTKTASPLPRKLRWRRRERPG